MVFRRPVIRTPARDVYFKPFLPAFLVFGALMILIALSWRTALQDVRTQRSQSVADKSSFVRGTLIQRFSIYEDALRAATGVYAASDSVTRSEWKDFVDSLKLHERYPGIQALSYIKVVNHDERQAFIQSVRDEGISDFSIYPEGDRSSYAVLQFIALTTGDKTEETAQRAATALGYDMYSDPTRRAAMESAMRSGEPRLSETISLLQNTNAEPNGFLLYMPLYKKGMPHGTEKEREAAIEGYFYAPFFTEDMFSSLFVNKEPTFGFSVYDGVPGEHSLLYESHPSLSSPEFFVAGQDTLLLYGRSWNIVYKTSKDIVPISIRARPVSVAFGGTVFALALASTLYLLIQRRTRALAYEEQLKFDEVKDEVLSLASHQLRTPATAVKQYVSMVKNGFAGKISKEQRKLLQMAYESNERQLTTIDDLLYVARVDSGQATLTVERVNLSELLSSVAADQMDTIKSRNQKLQLRGVTSAVMVEGDSHYLRMIFENLLSNASKYSLDKKSIAVTLKKTADNAIVTFKDHGVGIDRKDFSSVFQKFSRISNELTRQTDGSGIGLYLASQLAHLHGGDITFTSEPHKGSSFIVMLPCRQPEKAV